MRKVVPELCVNDVTESEAEVEMSIADHGAEDDEEQRVARFQVYGDIQDDDQEREGVVAHGERARPLHPSRQEVQEHELTHIHYRSWGVHCV